CSGPAPASMFHHSRGQRCARRTPPCCSSSVTAPTRSRSRSIWGSSTTRPRRPGGPRANRKSLSIVASPLTSAWGWENSAARTRTRPNPSW
ncbi:hypothetical protein SSAG_00342, partial [Streptomyces sp. Mg1]